MPLPAVLDWWLHLHLVFQGELTVLQQSLVLCPDVPHEVRVDLKSHVTVSPHPSRIQLRVAPQTLKKPTTVPLLPSLPLVGSNNQFFQRLQKAKRRSSNLTRSGAMIARNRFPQVPPVNEQKRLCSVPHDPRQFRPQFWTISQLSEHFRAAPPPSHTHGLVQSRLRSPQTCLQSCSA